MTSRASTASRLRAAAGSAVFLVVAPGVVVGLLPWLITGWRAGHWGPAAATAGVLLIVAGCGFLLFAFGQFAVEGIGTPALVSGWRRRLRVTRR